MQNLYTISTNREVPEENLTDGERFAIFYHGLFDFPLNFSEMIRWKGGKGVGGFESATSIASKNGFYFIEGKEGIVYKRVLRKRISAKKLEIAKRAAKVLSFTPGIKMIAVTGSLAMENSSEDSDIDLMIITKKGMLWTTRLISYFVNWLIGVKTRRPGDRNQKDRLCLNMWLDEADLVWPKKDRNVYTAHEIGQILPLVNKNSTYEKFLSVNKWILNFWPNSVKISSSKINGKWKKENGKSAPSLLEKLCYQIQYQYMKRKISREVVTPTRALFHPQDWGKVVLGRLRT